MRRSCPSLATLQGISLTEPAPSTTMASGTPRWWPDAAGWRARLGVLVPHLDIVPECELAAMLPEGVSLHATRVPFGISDGGTVVGADAVRAFAAPPHVDDATELLATAPIDGVIFAFTSSSYLLGVEGDAALRRRLEGKARGKPVVIPCEATVAALRALRARTLAVVDPPWFPADFSALGSSYFNSHGIEVVYHAPAGLEYSELPAGQLEIEPDRLYEWIRKNVPTSADAVFIGGNGLRSVAAIEALEGELARPVLTANQVALWQALSCLGCSTSVPHYGRLLAGTAAP